MALSRACQQDTCLPRAKVRQEGDVASWNRTSLVIRYMRVSPEGWTLNFHQTPLSESRSLQAMGARVRSGPRRRSSASSDEARRIVITRLKDAHHEHTAMTTTTYQGQDRRRHEKTNNGAKLFGRRTIDRISRPHSVIPNWLLLVIIGILLYAACEFT